MTTPTLNSPNSKLDIGFRVLKLDSTNMKDVYYAPGDYDGTFSISWNPTSRMTAPTSTCCSAA